VQKAINDILTTIYETEFLDCSFGFRSGRSCHDAIKAVARIFETKKVSYIVDDDIKGFSDNVDQQLTIMITRENQEISLVSLYLFYK
jgi:RNA-directed DNA polymerase